ncbi:MAG: enoyl-CoA hydratase/isomerase family protein [Myxococcales bacterium]|nr:enoyl-CoA hydratase/isomerase family protein [Myxococcales bacterium]
MTNKVTVERLDKVMLVKINRPHRRNCVDAETAQALHDAICSYRDDAELNVLVVAGAGEQAFCSGADLSDVQALAKREGAFESGPMGFTHVRDVGKPTIAAINGYCTAGGLEVACWCDFRIGDSKAQLGVLNRRWGVPLVDGGTQRLPRIVGLGNAMYMIHTGVLLDAWQAHQMGLLQEVVPAGKAVERALELAAAIAEFPRRGLRGDRQATLDGLGRPLAEGLRIEVAAHADTLGDPEMSEMLVAFAGGQRPASIVKPPLPPKG